MNTTSFALRCVQTTPHTNYLQNEFIRLHFNGIPEMNGFTCISKVNVCEFFESSSTLREKRAGEFKTEEGSFLAICPLFFTPLSKYKLLHMMENAFTIF